METLRRRNYGSGAKNLVLLQNQCKLSQFGKLVIYIRKKITHKGENYSDKLKKHYFCNGTLIIMILCTNLKIKILRNDKNIISSISVTDIVFDDYLGKWNYRAIPK